MSVIEFIVIFSDSRAVNTVIRVQTSRN